MKFLFFLPLCFFLSASAQTPNAWIRINQLGYTPAGGKVAVLGAREKISVPLFELIDADTKQVVFTGHTGKSFGKYGPFEDTYRLDFSACTKKGKYFIRAGNTESPVFSINENVYDGAADFCLRYMRQQRSGFNPFLKDSCHLYDGYTLYAPVPDSTHIDVVGGWHDATDYLQYSSTTANATYHLLAAYRDFPGVFKDEKQANGLDGKNQIPDVLDEAKWGLKWLLKMHPKDTWLFNQLGDDRDHRGMRLPKEDTNFYGRGLERPVYFCSGEPQVRGKLMNNTTGVASTAGKFASAFALGSEIFSTDRGILCRYAYKKSSIGLCTSAKSRGHAKRLLYSRLIFMRKTTGQTTWNLRRLWKALYKKRVRAKAHCLLPPTNMRLKNLLRPGLGKIRPNITSGTLFINIGHYELAKALKGARRDTIIRFYKEGIDRVWRKSASNAFYRGIPFIWCSNNLTVSFAIQCYWYRQLSGDNSYQALEQACFDWIFGCNPWGTSMVYGLPAWGDTPDDPHSSLSHLNKYPIDGGLVDGPVYTSIYKNLLGIELHKEDAYAAFQSDLAVYHDDYGDYSTNEPTMDGTASLVYLLAAEQTQARAIHHFTFSEGGIVRGDSTKRNCIGIYRR